MASQQSSQGDSAPLVEYVLKKSKKSAPSRQSQWVCIMPDTMAPVSPDSATGDGPSFISLLDPRTGSSKRYLLSKDGTDICEVLEFSDEPRSWFIGNSVQREGNLYMCTPVDPLFLALPYLTGAAKSGKFTTLDAILEDATYNSRVLEKCVHCEQWQHVCDMKVLQSGMKVYRYNQERTLQWLKTKVESLCEQLDKQGVYVGSGSQSAVLVRSSKQSDITKEDYVCYACGIVSDYLPKKVAEELTNSYSFSKSKARKLEKNEEICASEPPAKKHCCEDGLASHPGSTEPLEDYTKFNLPSSTDRANKVPKLTAAQKSLAKVDKSGMKSLASFFTNKNKKKS